MDPVSAVGLASAIITFIEFGSKLLKGAKEIHDSANDSLEKNEARRVMAEAMKEAVANLKTPDRMQISPQQQRLCDLADKCKDLSRRLLELLDNIKPKNKKPIHVSRAAYRAWRKEPDIKALEQSLGDCRSQLALSLAYLASKNSAENSDKILATVQKDSSKLEQLQDHMKELRKGMVAQVIGDEALEQLGLVLEIHEEALNAIYRDRILRSLQFEDMHRRDDRVRDPYENTFEWILGDDGEITSDDASAVSSESSLSAASHMSDENIYDRFREVRNGQATHMFLKWLSSGSGIFHVSGKLGSGKSTLMKFLSTNPRTRTELKKWAGDRTLVLASFFFWKPGSDMQKSLEGLFRSLLCDVLTICPHLIQDTMPEYWRLAEESPWQIQTKFRIPVSTINSALKSVISNERLYKSHRFCFFIDGLDEYEGTDRQDPTYLATLLNSWAKDSQRCLKLCVSSREHNVFMNAFSKNKRLRLHELTWFDMQEYVAGLLQDMHTDTLSTDLRKDLIRSIPEKANGIFLWTVLVVRTIRCKLEDGEPEAGLIKLLDSLPRGLISVLQRILDDLDADNRRRVYQTMAMLTAANANGVPFSLLAFSFLDDYEEDSEFSTNGDIPTDKTKEFARRRLRGVCGGLIEIQDPRARDGELGTSWGSLEYTHRSLPEMFGEGTLKREMEVALTKFDAINAFSQLAFAAAQFLGGTKIWESQNICAGLARMRLRNEVEQAPYPFLERIASWVELHSSQHNVSHRINLLNGTTEALSLSLATLQEFGTHDDPEYAYYGSVLCIAAFYRYFTYIKWKIQQDPKGTSGSFERAALAYIVLHLRTRDTCSWDFFFDSGVFTDLTATRCIAVGPNFGLVQSGNLTIWQRFLVYEFMKWALGNGKRRIRGDPGPTVQKFLEHGASREFSITAPYSKATRHKFSVILGFEGTTQVSLMPRDAVMFDQKPGFLKILGRARDSDTYTFQEWIQAADYPNKRRILELLGDGGKGRP